LIILHEIHLKRNYYIIFIHIYINILGCNCAIAAIRFKSTIGGSSSFCSQPTGGLGGGDIRKSFSGSGGRKCLSGFAPRNTIGYEKNINKRKQDLGTYTSKICVQFCTMKKIFMKV